MPWLSPIPYKLVRTTASESFRTMKKGTTGLPLPPHPGGFGVARKHHIHEGVDLYVPEGTPVTTVEDGIVCAILPFTGLIADSPWWNDTWAVMVEGVSGVVLYGEINPALDRLGLGDSVKAGEQIGTVVTVLKQDKGRPMSMLHLELYTNGTRSPVEWALDTPRPSNLIDPTGFLPVNDRRK